MPRLIRLAVATAVLAAAAPALAADYLNYPELRPSYPDEWAYSDDNPLRFEVGLRYWYSIGSQDFDVGGLSQSADTQTHSGEAHFRIDDKSTSSFLKGMAGYSFAMEGDYTTSGGGGPTPIYNGQLGYAGADFGYTPWGNENVQFGGLAGYLYWNDSPNLGRGTFTTADSVADITWTTASNNYNLPFDSEPSNLNIHALRLGVTGRAEISELVDITAEAAAVPYAYVSGTLGDVAGGAGGGPFNTDRDFNSSPINFTGMGYGAMGEVMVGFKPTDHVAVRLGGRAWYLRGQTEATWTEVSVTAPQDNDANPDFETPPTLVNQGWITTLNNPFEIFRYGLLAELSVQF